MTPHINIEMALFILGNPRVNVLTQIGGDREVGLVTVRVDGDHMSRVRPATRPSEDHDSPSTVLLFNHR